MKYSFIIYLYYYISKHTNEDIFNDPLIIIIIDTYGTHSYI